MSTGRAILESQKGVTESTGTAILEISNFGAKKGQLSPPGAKTWKKSIFEAKKGQLSLLGAQS